MPIIAPFFELGRIQLDHCFHYAASWTLFFGYHKLTSLNVKLVPWRCYSEVIWLLIEAWLLSIACSSMQWSSIVVLRGAVPSIRI